MAVEKRDIFQPDDRYQATRYKFFADRVDYLEAFCSSINAAIAAEAGE